VCALSVLGNQGVSPSAFLLFRPSLPVEHAVGHTVIKDAINSMAKPKTWAPAATGIIDTANIHAEMAKKERLEKAKREQRKTDIVISSATVQMQRNKGWNNQQKMNSLKS